MLNFERKNSWLEFFDGENYQLTRLSWLHFIIRPQRLRNPIDYNNYVNLQTIHQHHNSNSKENSKNKYNKNISTFFEINS